MPIQFRCSHCRQLLSISTKRAGTMIVCPACTSETKVPSLEDAAAGAATKPAKSPGTHPPVEKTLEKRRPSESVPETAPEFPYANRPAEGKIPEPPKPPVSALAPKEKQAPADKTEKTAPVPERSRPTRSAYDQGGASSHKPLFSHEEDEEEDEDEEVHHHPKKKRFMDDTVDMTAMVDVTFLLLIFFMVTASFAAQKVFETSAPEQEAEGSGGGGAAVASTVEDVESNSVLVEIDGTDRIEVEGQPISSLFQLREVLASKIATEQKTDLLIQAQYEATHGAVVSVTDVAMDAGMQNVRRISRKADD